MTEEMQEQSADAVELAAELTMAWLGNPNVRATTEEVLAFFKSMHGTIGELANGNAATPADETPEYLPAVPPTTSVKRDYIVSLITGKKFKSLKRHLSSHGLTPQEYRERYALKPDYPMVATGYSAQRREIAKKLGLGRKPDEMQAKSIQAAPAPAPVPAAETMPAKPAPKRAAKPKVAAKPKAAAKFAAKTQAAVKPKSTAKPAAKSSARPAPAKRGRPKKADAPAA